MSPLGQFPNFLTDGSRIRRPPVDDTKNPIFRLARRTSKNFQYPASGRSPGSVFPALFSFIRACAAFLSRFRHFCPDIYLIANYYYLFPFQHPLSRQSSAIFAVNFPCRFSKKAPRSVLCSALLPLVSFPVLSFAAFSRFNDFLRPAPLPSFTRYHLLLLLPGSPLRPAFPFFAGIGRNGPLSALRPIRFPAAPAHDPKVLLSSHPARQMVLPGLKIKISYPYQCYHKDGKGYQILFVVKVVTF